MCLQACSQYGLFTHLSLVTRKMVVSIFCHQIPRRHLIRKINLCARVINRWFNSVTTCIYLIGPCYTHTRSDRVDICPHPFNQNCTCSTCKTIKQDFDARRVKFKCHLTFCSKTLIGWVVVVVNMSLCSNTYHLTAYSCSSASSLFLSSLNFTPYVSVFETVELHCECETTDLELAGIIG